MGKPLTEEHKKKLSLALKGKPFTGIKCDWNGRKHTDESKTKMSKSAKGRKMSIKTRKKLSESNSREKSYLWKGGKTKENYTIRHTLKYRLWRESVFKRDKFTCIICRKVGGELNADHIKKFADYPELRFSIDNGRTLCVPCHRKTDTYGNKKTKKILEQLLNIN